MPSVRTEDGRLYAWPDPPTRWQRLVARFRAFRDRNRDPWEGWKVIGFTDGAPYDKHTGEGPTP